MKLELEVLEDRCLLSAVVNLSGGVLSVLADPSGTSAIVTQPDANTVALQINSEAGKLYRFSAATVANIIFTGGAADDYFVNATGIASVQFGGFDNPGGRDYLEGGTGNDWLFGGLGPFVQSVLFDSGGASNTLQGGLTGKTNIQAFGANDTITVGSFGGDVYKIIGGGSVSATSGVGNLFVNPQVTVTAGTSYTIVTFFQPALTPSATNTVGAAVLQKDRFGHGVVYLIPQVTTGVSFTVNEFAGKELVTYTDINGSQSFVFNQADVSWFSSFGSAGNDTYIYNTTRNVITYGAAGNDFILGGFGQNLLKGSAGNDILIGRGFFDDLSANGGNDVLIELNPNAFQIFRPDPAATDTVIFARRNNLKNGVTILGVPQMVFFF